MNKKHKCIYLKQICDIKNFIDILSKNTRDINFQKELLNIYEEYNFLKVKAQNFLLEQNIIVRKKINFYFLNSICKISIIFKKKNTSFLAKKLIEKINYYLLINYRNLKIKSSIANIELLKELINTAESSIEKLKNHL